MKKVIRSIAIVMIAVGVMFMPIATPVHATIGHVVSLPPAMMVLPNFGQIFTLRLSGFDQVGNTVTVHYMAIVNHSGSAIQYDRDVTFQPSNGIAGLQSALKADLQAAYAQDFPGNTVTTVIGPQYVLY